MSKPLISGRPLTKEELIKQIKQLSKPILQDDILLKRIIYLCKLFSVSEIKEIPDKIKLKNTI